MSATSLLIGYVGGLGLAASPAIALRGIYLTRPSRGTSLAYAAVGLAVALVAVFASFFSGWGMLAGLATSAVLFVLWRRHRRPDFVVEGDVLLRDAVDPAAAAALAVFEQEARQAAAAKDEAEAGAPASPAAPPN